MIRVLLILIEMRYKCKTSAGGGREREGCVARESSVLWGFVCLLEKRREERRSRENGRLSFCVQGCRRSFYTMG